MIRRFALSRALSLALSIIACLLPASLFGQAAKPSATPSPASASSPAAPAIPTHLNCLPASPCDIELEPAESVNEVLVAGGKEWSTQVVATGVKPKVSHVIVWPDSGIASGSNNQAVSNPAGISGMVMKLGSRKYLKSVKASASKVQPRKQLASNIHPDISDAAHAATATAPNSTSG